MSDLPGMPKISVGAATRPARLAEIWMAAVVAIAITFLLGQATANAQAPDFSGKTVTIVVGFGPGGGYDTWARTVADHLGPYLPGEPKIIVENMPGGGGNRASVFLASVAPKDGTVISVFPQPFPLEGLIGRLGDNVAPEDFGYIGRLTTHTATLLMWNTSPVKTLADAMSREAPIATPGIDVTNIVARIANERMGTQFKIIQGYEGSSEMAFALEREEVEGMSQSLESLVAKHPDWLPEGKVNVIWQVATTRNDLLPDVPAVTELPIDGDDAALLRLLASLGDTGRPLGMPPGVAPEVLQVFRDAFDAMVQDPDFIADAEKRGLQLDTEPGAAVAASVAAAMNTPEPTVDALKALLGAAP